jgi:hypothetical protein
VAGDAAGLDNSATAWFGGGGVFTPFLDGALDWVGVNWLPREALAADLSGEVGIDVRKDELEGFEVSANDVLLFGWR